MLLLLAYCCLVFWLSLYTLDSQGKIKSAHTIVSVLFCNFFFQLASASASASAAASASASAHRNNLFRLWAQFSCFSFLFNRCCCLLRFSCSRSSFAVLFNLLFYSICCFISICCFVNLLLPLLSVARHLWAISAVSDLRFLLSYPSTAIPL